MLALALIVRLLVVVATPGFIPTSDARDYDQAAVGLVRHGSFPASQLAAGGGPSAFRPPLLPIALAGVYELTGVSSQTVRWDAGRVLEALLGTAVVALICLIALRVWGPGAALVSGAIAAVYPPLLLVGSSLMSESLYIPMVLAAVLAALIHRDSGHRWRWAVLAGILIGLAALTRSNGVALVLPIGALAWTERRRRSWRSWRSPVIVLAAMIVTLVPWTVRNLNLFHQLVPISTESGYALAGTYSTAAQNRTDYPAMWGPPDIAQALARGRSLNEAQLSSRLDRSALAFVEAHPASVVKVSFWNTLRMLNLTGAGLENVLARDEAYPPGLAALSVYAFWLLGALAIVGAGTLAARRAPRALWACPLVIFLSSLFVVGSTRYRSPADPFVVMLAALGALAAWRRLGSPPAPIT